MTQIVPHVTVPVTETEPSPKLTPQLLAALAREIAWNVRDEADILATFKIPVATYEKLKALEWFEKAVDEARIEWQGSTNAAVRVQVEAASTLELALPHVYVRMSSGKEPLNHVIDAAKLLADIAGVKKSPTQGQQSERFQITINLGADTKLDFDLSRSPIGGDPALAALPVPVVDDTEDRV